MAERIAGIALMPRESRNGVYYDTEELKKFDGVSVPLRVEHDKDTHIGEVTFTFDEMKSQVKYEATVFDSEWQDILSNEQYQVSIGASVLEQRELCDEVRAKCLNAPVLNEILELSVVRVPGIPESTLHVIESSNVQYIKILSEAKPELITSNIQTTEKEKHMTNETLDNKVEEKVKVTIETDGEVEVGKAEAKTEDAAPAVEAPAPTTEEAPKAEIATEKVAERIEKSNEDTLKAVIETVKDAWQPKSEVAESTDSGYVDEAFTDESAKKFLDKVFENGYGRLVIDKEGWIENHTQEGRITANGSVEEAVSTSGTIPGVKQRANVSIQIGSKTATSIRQYGQFEALPTGQNTARFYRITVPDAGAITESVSSDITASTHTLTSIDVTCSIRGWRQTILKAQLEDYPASFLNAIRETARLEAIRDEHKLILEDLASTARDYGGVTTAPYHIGGSDGAATSNTTEEDADGEFDEDGLTFAKRYLQELGQDVGPGKLVAFLTPRAFESLATSSAISEYAQIGNPSVTKLGQLERLYGIDIVVTNEVKGDVSNADRNIVAVKGASFGLASQRTMELELQKQVAGQYWDLVWTHRIGVNVIDPNTYIIVSSVNS
mgnify:CR=1 FL=1|tara:strand:- start:10543 stop:12372 length:1830 start_codon:yes stop_codon:yes gene_type:complete